MRWFLKGQLASHKDVHNLRVESTIQVQETNPDLVVRPFEGPFPTLPPPQKKDLF